MVIWNSWHSHIYFWECYFCSPHIFFLEQNINNSNILFFSFKSFAIGLLFVFTLFYLLHFVWNRKKVIKEEEIDIIGNTKN